MFVSFNGYAYGDTDHRSRGVSIIEVIANPDKFHGKMVRIIGVGRIEFEGDSICLNNESYQYRVGRNCLRLALGLFQQLVKSNKLKQYNGKYVLIEGKFKKNKPEYLNLYGGEIENITRYELWEK